MLIQTQQQLQKHNKGGKRASAQNHEICLSVCVSACNYTYWTFGVFDSKATINNKEIRVTTFKNEQFHHIAPGKSSRLKIMKIFYRQSSTAAMLSAALNFLVLWKRNWVLFTRRRLSHDLREKKEHLNWQLVFSELCDLNSSE